MKFNSDKETISSGWDNLSVRFHYNFLENAIISNLESCNEVLDIGSGYGHWIDFYQQVYGANVSCIEINEEQVVDLEQRYKIPILLGSIVDRRFDKKFDVINAIGVLHHIMKDRDLYKAINNMRSMLAPGGVIMIGTRVDFLKPTNERYRNYIPGFKWRDRSFRTLAKWRAWFPDAVIVRSDPPWWCRKHLDLIVYIDS